MDHMDQQTAPRPIPPPPAAPYQVPVQPRPMPVPVQPRQTKNKFLTVLWALIPGAGQMYQGLMRRGVMVMSLFAGSIVLLMLLQMSELVFVLPVIWFYSFFDTINRLNMTTEELRQQPDQLFDDKTRISGWLSKEKHTLAGGLLIALSAWLLLKGLVSSSYGYSLTHFMNRRTAELLTTIVDRLPMLILPVFCILIGVRLIVGGKDRNADKTRTYDEYTIPKEKDDQ